MSTSNKRDYKKIVSNLIVMELIKCQWTSRVVGTLFETPTVNGL